jgi:ribosome-binding factor A
MRKVNELLREVVAEEVTDLKDPGLGFITVTGVDTAPDLRTATVFYTVLGTDEEKAATAEALRRAAPRLQASIGNQVRIKYTPRLRFAVDRSIDEGLRIDTILHELEEERDHDANR